MNESEQDREDRDMAASHQADLERFHQEARAALIAAAGRPLTPDEISAISWWGNLGVTDKEIHL